MDRQSVALTPLTGRHVGGLGLGVLAFWRGGRESKVVPALSGVAAFAATRGRAAAATTLATAATPRAIQSAPAFLLDLAFLVDRVVDSAVEAKACDVLGVLIGRRYQTEPKLGGRIIHETANNSHGLGPL